MERTRLHELPESALQNVLRNLSSKPARLSWVPFVDSNDAITAMDPSCALCGVARASFTRLCTKSTIVTEDERNWVVLSEVSEPWLPPKWLQTDGEYLTELRMDIELTAFDSGRIDEMLQELERNCLALRHLDIVNVSRNEIVATRVRRHLLEKTRGRLHELVAKTVDIPAIQLFCSGIKKLVLGDISRHGFLDMLSVVGPTLESINCRAELSERDCEQTQQLCPKLFYIVLWVRNHHSAYAGLLCSYGAQLRYAEFHSLGVANLERIMISCPNVRCSLDLIQYMDDGHTVDDDGHTLDEWKVLGPCAKSAFLDLDDLQNEHNMQEVKLALRPSVNLEDVSLHVSPDDAVRGVKELFCYDRPLLTSLELGIYGDNGDDLGEVLQELSAHVGHLRKFSFKANSEDNGSFEAVARNALMLEDVRIRFNDRILGENVPGLTAPEYEEQLAGTVAAFLKCPKLRLLEVFPDIKDEEEIEAIANLCCRVRLKGSNRFYVKVHGIEYLA